MLDNIRFIDCGFVCKYDMIIYKAYSENVKNTHK